AALAGGAVFWLRAALGGAGHAPPAVTAGLALAIPWPTLAWTTALEPALPYLSIALPFALLTIVGGIDNTESAVAAGDEYRTRDILLVESVATVLAALCGGVIQDTPYIGHPAYKAMGARSGYTLATGLVVGVGASLGVLVHSPLPNGAVFWPWAPAAPLGVAATLAGAYGALAGLTLLAARRTRSR